MAPNAAETTTRVDPGPGIRPPLSCTWQVNQRRTATGTDDVRLSPGPGGHRRAMLDWHWLRCPSSRDALETVRCCREALRDVRLQSLPTWIGRYLPEGVGGLT